jgi:hypothetical protein
MRGDQGMRVGTIYFNPTMDKTEIRWNDDFVVSHRVTRLDVLKDMQVITESAYDYTIDGEDDGYLPETKQG